MWLAPVVIGYFMKKYEEKHAKKQQAKTLANTSN